MFACQWMHISGGGGTNGLVKPELQSAPMLLRAVFKGDVTKCNLAIM